MARTPKVVEDRRQQILEAAFRVFARKGFLRATNKDIAREIGVTSGLIYHYFESKEELLRAVIFTLSPMHVLHSLPEKVLALPPEEFFPFVIAQVLEQVEQPQFVQLIRVILPEVIHDSSFASIPSSVLSQVAALLAAYVEKCYAQMTVPVSMVDVELVFHLLVSTMMGILLRRQIFQDPQMLAYSRPQIVQQLTAIVLDGLHLRS